MTDISYKELFEYYKSRSEMFEQELKHFKVDFQFMDTLQHRYWDLWKEVKDDIELRDKIRENAIKLTSGNYPSGKTKRYWHEFFKKYFSICRIKKSLSLEK